MFSKFNASTPDSTTINTSVNEQLFIYLVVDMQLLPGVNVSSLPGVNMSSLPGMDVIYLACVCKSQSTTACARQPTCR